MVEKNARITSSDDDEIDLLQLLMLIWRGKGVIVFCIPLCIGLAYIYINYIATPRFQATARILLEQRQAQVVDLNSVMSGVSTDAVALNTELEIIRSPVIIEKLVTDLDLHQDPEFNPDLRPVEPWSRRGIQAKVEEFVFGPPPPRPVQSEEAAIQSALFWTTEAIDAQQERGTLLFNINVRSQSPENARRMANHLADLYIENQLRTKFEAVEYAIDWLSDRVRELEVELEGRDKAVEDLISNQNLLSPEAIEALNLRARDLSARLETLEGTRANAELAYEQAQKLSNSSDLEAILSHFNDPVLSNIAQHSTLDPLDDERFKDRVHYLVVLQGVEVERLAVQSVALNRSLDKLQQEIEQATQQLTQLQTLTREAESTRALFETFSARLKETSLQAGLQRADSRVISPAGRALLVEPREHILYPLSVALGILLGICLLLLRQFAQRGFRAATEVESQTGHDVIGQMPVLPIRKRQQLVPYLKDKPTSAASEAMRDLRSSVLLSDKDGPPPIIMVTSTVPAEGKTSVSVALAINMATINKKVIIVEGDIRRGTLGQYFDVPAKNEGIDGVLNGTAEVEDAIFKDDRLGFDVLATKKTQTNATDLFMSDNFLNLLSHLRDHYDHIIIDTPPVMVVPDARVIAQHCNSVLYAVRWNKTSKALVSDGLNHLAALDVDVTGIVLTQVDAKGMKRYGYGDRYGAYSSYGGGYYSN